MHVKSVKANAMQICRFVRKIAKVKMNYVPKTISLEMRTKNILFTSWVSVYFKIMLWYVQRLLLIIYLVMYHTV